MQCLIGDFILLSDSYDAGHDLLYRLYLVATIVGVVGGFLGIIVLIRQGSLLRKSTKAAENAANAATDSANALKNAERPWILVAEADRSAENLKSPEIPKDHPQTHLAAYVTFKNYGNTPAFITKLIGGIDIVSADATRSFLPIGDAPYTGSIEPVLPPQDNSGRIVFIVNHPSTDVEWRQLIRSNKLMVIHGTVEYRDPFGGNHTSKFCYVYSFGTQVGFHSTFGRPEFNYYT
jgi:hypothetical protein